MSEKQHINMKVDFELNELQFKMIKIGGITNILSGIFVVWVLYGQVKFSLLINWYIALVFINLINMSFSIFYQYKKVTPEQIGLWITIYHIILMTLCIVWGSIGFLFIPDNLQYQLYITVFLLAVLVGFSLGTVTDFVASIISIGCLLIPYIVYHIYLGVQSVLTIGYDPKLNLGFSLVLFILGSFLLVACYIGNKLVRKSFTLTFENLALNRKLENINRFLEQRVKERTLELENSLKVVTYQATHDLLTELPNQRLLLEYMQAAVNSADENKHIFCVVSFSLNEIGKINDGLGHKAGDIVIKTVAQRFQNLLNKNTRYIVTLSRKDTFVIIINPIASLSEVEEKVNLLFSILDEPLHTEEQVIKLTASMGVSIYPRNGKDISSLLKNADAAMFAATRKGGNSINMYQSEINAEISKQLEMEVQLHSAVKNNEFLLQYQPFIDLKTGEIVGAEALVRWQSPLLGFISPMDFIPLAEANGIIIPLGEWVFRTACRQLKTWHDLGFTSLQIAINLSARQLLQKDIVHTISRILTETQLNSASVELELTETTAFLGDVIPTVREFEKMGLHLSIDDFGTGYSGLTNLKLFSISKLKIDRSFVQDIVINNDSKMIVENTINLAKKLNISVLAEGVETKEQLQFLKDNGCDYIQGYYFSRPLNADVFTELLKNKKRYII